MRMLHALDKLVVIPHIDLIVMLTPADTLAAAFRDFLAPAAILAAGLAHPRAFAALADF